MRFHKILIITAFCSTLSLACSPTTDEGPSRRIAGDDWQQEVDDLKEEVWNRIPTEALKKPGFYGAMVEKCHSYFRRSNSLFDKTTWVTDLYHHCADMVHRFSEKLDFNWDHDVAFKRSLRDLLNQDLTLDYFRYLQEKLDPIVQGTSDKSYMEMSTLLFTETLIFISTNEPDIQQQPRKLEDRTIYYLAVLFQDISNSNFIDRLRGTLEIREGEKPVWQEPYENMLNALGQLENERGIAVMAHPRFSDYKPQMNRWYHFYVPALLAKRLKEDTGDSVAAVALPILMNLIYEFETGFFLEWGSFPSEPEPSQIVTLLQSSEEPAEGPSKEIIYETFNDIYLGYAGAYYGARRQDMWLGRYRVEESFTFECSTDSRAPDAKTFLLDYLAQITYKPTDKEWKFYSCPTPAIPLDELEG